MVDPLWAIKKNQGKIDPEDYLVFLCDPFAWNFDSLTRWMLEQMVKQEKVWIVIYTYYNQDGWPLYTGCTKDFYLTHRLNSKKFSFFSEIEYVDLFDIKLSWVEESAVRDIWKQYVRNRNPLHNTRKYENLPLTFDGFSPNKLVLRREIERVWEDVRKQSEEDCADGTD